MTVPQIAEIVFGVVFAVAGYLLGLIPFRRMLKGPAGLVLDITKIVLAGLIGWSVTQYLIQNHVPLGFRVDLWDTPLKVGIVAAIAALIGHFFPVWRLFRKRRSVER